MAVPKALKRLVDACHARGLAVLLDVVYNHFGPSGNYLPRFGPYLTHRYPTPWGDAINFDERGSDEVRRCSATTRSCGCAIIISTDCGSTRCTRSSIHRRSIFSNSSRAKSKYSSKSSGVGSYLSRRATSTIHGSCEPRTRWLWINAQWSDDFHHALHSVLTGERAGYYADFGSIADLAKALRQAWVYDGRYSNFRGRRHGRSPAGLSGHAFLGYAQTHDQIGNRATGRAQRASDEYRPAQDRGGAGTHVAVRADALSGRRMGRIDAVPLFHGT